MGTVAKKTEDVENEQQRSFTGSKNDQSEVGHKRLGCEANQVGAMMDAEKLNPSENMHAFTIQDTGGSEKTIDHGIGLITEMLQDANRVSRETAPASELILGLECGGSDAYSGISANPALGAAADLLVQGADKILETNGTEE